MKRLLVSLLVSISLLPTIIFCTEPAVEQLYPHTIGDQQYCLVGPRGEGLTQQDQGILQRMTHTAIRQRVVDVLCKRWAILPSFIGGLCIANLAQRHCNPVAIIPSMIVAGFGCYKIGKYVASWFYRARKRAINQERNANLTHALQMIRDHGQEIALGRLYMPYAGRRDVANTRIELGIRCVRPEQPQERIIQELFDSVPKVNVQPLEARLRNGSLGLSQAVGLTLDEIVHNTDGDLGLGFGWPSEPALEYKMDGDRNRCSLSGQQAVIDGLMKQIAECEGQHVDRWPKLSYMWHRLRRLFV